LLLLLLLMLDRSLMPGRGSSGVHLGLGTLGSRCPVLLGRRSHGCLGLGTLGSRRPLLLGLEALLGLEDHLVDVRVPRSKRGRRSPGKRRSGESVDGKSPRSRTRSKVRICEGPLRHQPVPLSGRPLGGFSLPIDLTLRAASEILEGRRPIEGRSPGEIRGRERTHGAAGPRLLGMRW
jgi:hypothetical protein